MSQLTTEQDINATIEARLERIRNLSLNIGVNHFEDYEIVICKDPDFPSQYGWYIEVLVDGQRHAVRSCWEYDNMEYAFMDARAGMRGMANDGY